MDWETVKTEYITTNTSYSKLAKKYETSKAVIAQKAGPEGWVKLRKQYKNAVLTKTLRKAANKESDRLSRIGTLANKALDVAMGAFEDEQQFNKYIVERREKYAVPELEGDEGDAAQFIIEKQWSEEQQFSKVDTRALKDLTAVIKDLASIIRNVYGIPTQAEAEAQRIAAERLALDKKKAEADSTDDGVEIVIAGEAEEWAR